MGCEAAAFQRETVNQSRAAATGSGSVADQTGGKGREVDVVSRCCGG